MKAAGGLILIVEDHMAIAEMVGEFLEARGYEVDFARDGADALRLTAENTYDAIILDRTLPRLDGLDVCRRIRAEQRRSTPVLMLTARDTLDDKVTGLEAGADDYLTKPFAIQELEARIAVLIRRGRKARSRNWRRASPCSSAAAARRWAAASCAWPTWCWTRKR
jgi:DNA-binding response OmpR family regulator